MNKKKAMGIALALVLATAGYGFGQAGAVPDDQAALHKKLLNTATFSSLGLSTDIQKAEYLSIGLDDFQFWVTNGSRATSPIDFLTDVKALVTDSMIRQLQFVQQYGDLMDYNSTSRFMAQFLRLNPKDAAILKKGELMESYWGSNWKQLI